MDATLSPVFGQLACLRLCDPRVLRSQLTASEREVTLIIELAGDLSRHKLGDVWQVLFEFDYAAAARYHGHRAG